MRIIRGRFGRRRFNVPTNITARPTTDFARENIFNVIDNLIDLDDKSALDLFAGTGAITFEFLSRGCNSVTSVEKAATQWRFISDVAQQLDVTSQLNLIRGDVFRFIETCSTQFDIIFADPPYNMPRFDDVPTAILNSSMVKPGTIVIIEHSRDHDFSSLPGFMEHRTYGSVNFSIFEV